MPACVDSTRSVRLHGRHAGILRRLALDRVGFAYDPAYASAPGAAPLSACLPLAGTPASSDAATAWFQGLLPEGLRRAQLARLVGTAGLDLWTLLDAAGAECAGAVQIVNPAYEDAPAFHSLDAPALDRLLHSTPVHPIATVDRSARISLAGAQEKVALTRMAGGGWAVPLAGAASTHILKPQSRRFPGLVENEHWCMTLARAAGAPAAATSIEPVGGRPVLVVERYDRVVAEDGRIARVHQEDLAQACATTRKYAAEGAPSLARMARVPGVSPAFLLERAVLNWILGNADGHAKNLSVLEPGTPRARLAPAYDVLCTETYPDLDRTLALHIGRATVPGDVSRSTVAECARALGLDPDAVLAQLARLAGAVAEAAGRSVLEPFMLRMTVRDLVRSRAERAASDFASRGAAATVPSNPPPVGTASSTDAAASALAPAPVRPGPVARPTGHRTRR